jgi:hypothetical protein
MGAVFGRGFGWVSKAGHRLFARGALHYLRKLRRARPGAKRVIQTDQSGRLQTHLKRLLADPTNADGFFCDRM